MRSFTASAPAGLINMNQRQHWAPKAQTAKAWRRWAYYQAVAAISRNQPPAIVTVELPVPDKRRRDPHNYHPTLKAIVDGLVDAGVWPDDTPEWVAVAAPVLVVRRDRLVTVRLTPMRPADDALDLISGAQRAQDGRKGSQATELSSGDGESATANGENESQWRGEAMAAVTKRVETAKGHTYRLDGEKVDGVTTIIGGGIPKPALVYWAANTIAGQVIERITVDNEGRAHADELVSYLRAIGAGEGGNRQNRWPNDGSFSRMAALETLKGLHWRDRDQAANKGTAVHDLAEKLTNGEEVDPPEIIAGHVDAYMDWWERWRPTDVATELVVANRKHKYMGSLDQLSIIGDERWLIDLKTNRSGPFPEVALQLAAYGNAEFIVMDDGEHPMPKIDRYGVLWLRADGHDFYEVYVTPHTFRVFLYAQQIHHFQKSDRSEHIGPALNPEEFAA